MVRRPALFVVALGTLGLALPAGAGAISRSAMLAKLNAERRVNRLPADVREKPEWSDRCAKHNDWMAAHHTLQHPEDPSTSDYSDDGNWAGTHSVLAEGSSWRTGNPWETAPGHLMQVMDPELTWTGFDERHGYSCMVTLGDLDPNIRRQPPSRSTLYSWPGNGRKRVPWYEIVENEYPHAPQEQLGIPQGVPTGPDMMVWWEGPGDPPSARPAVRVADPRGAHVSAGVVDGTGPNGWFVIPRKPLRPGTRYRVSATFALSSGSWTRAFSFTTQPYVPPRRLVRLTARVSGGYVKFTAHVKDPMNGRKARVTLSYKGGHFPTQTDRLFDGATWGITRPSHRAWVRLTIRSAKFSIGSTRYPATTFSIRYPR